MIILRNNDNGTFLNELFSDQREFGEKLDKADIWVAKHLNPKWVNEGYISMSEEDDEGISKFGK